MSLSKKEKREEIIVAVCLGSQLGFLFGIIAGRLIIHFQSVIGCVCEGTVGCVFGGIVAGISSAILLVRISKK
jgi:hypothetical protein